jgi:hypothetical protein
MPSGRLPGRHQPHSRPLVGLPVKPQAHEVERRRRRPPFDRDGPERRASPRRLKLPPHGQLAETAMRFAHLELSESQSSAGVAIAFNRAAKTTAGPAGSELGFLGRFEKRGGSRRLAAVGVSSLAQSVLLAPTPCFACEARSIRHETLRSNTSILAPLLRLRPVETNDFWNDCYDCYDCCPPHRPHMCACAFFVLKPLWMCTSLSSYMRMFYIHVI